MTISTVIVTPEVAREMLQKNTSNRSVKETVVNRYATDMRLGRWKSYTGETIKFSKSGSLIDGQHRLMAVIKSGMTIIIQIATGIDDDVFDVLDTGVVRSSRDVFHIYGATNVQIPSMIMVYKMVMEGVIDEKTVRRRVTTNTELLNIYSENKQKWDDAAKVGYKAYLDFGKVMPPSLTGGMYVVFSEINKDAAFDFISQLSTGMGACIPVILLRQKLIQDKTLPRKMPLTLKIALIIKAWNYYRIGGNPKILKFDYIRESIPKPI